MVKLSIVWTRLRQMQKDFKENLKMLKIKLVLKESVSPMKLKMQSIGKIHP